MRLNVVFKVVAVTVFVAAIFFPNAYAKPLQKQAWTIASPKGKIEVNLRGTPSDGVEYQVALNSAQGKKAVVQWSALGLVTNVFETVVIYPKAIRSDFSRSLEFVNLERGKGEDNYIMLTGKRSQNHAKFTTLSLLLRDKETQRLLNIDWRVYDDGVAFRYRLPEESNLHHQVLDEFTEFAIGEGGVHWGQPYDFVTIYHPSYETPYSNWPTGTTVPEKAGTGWGFPSLFNINGAWILLHESGLDQTYQGSHLQPEAPKGVYKIAPPLKDEAAGFGATFSASTLPWTMPWRFMVISDDIADIVESNMVFHLAKPSSIPDTRWIKPGVSSWSWWSDHASSRNMDALKSFIDLASDMGWPYSLMDANWNLISDNSMEELLLYAEKKHVGLNFWYNSGGRHNFVKEEPRNRLDDRLKRREEFARISRLGAKGVKVDFFQSDKQDIIRQYIEILEDAAEFKLMADFHGSTIPRGWERTYPNLMSMEAIQGAEFYTFSPDSDYGLQAPRLNTITPFTRNVIGSMDFTPVSYSHQAAKRYSTNAHETALAVIFESGIQHMADSVESFSSLPFEYKTFFKQLPTRWDDTKYLGGLPGDYVVMARRVDKRIYIAGLNGKDQPRSINVKLDEWLPSKSSGLLLYDGNEGSFASRRMDLVKGRIETVMEPFGGFVLIVEQ